MNQNPLDFKYAFNAPDSNSLFGPFSLAYFIIFTIGFLVSNYFYYFGKYRFSNNRLSYTLVNRASRNAAIVFTLGFLFFICRLAQLPPFSSRIFLDITLILGVYFIIRGIAYRSRVYPKARDEWTAMQLRNRRKETEVPAPTGVKAAPALRNAVPTTGTMATSSADAGSEENVILPATPGAPRIRSARGEKRRERKRNSR